MDPATLRRSTRLKSQSQFDSAQSNLSASQLLSATSTSAPPTSTNSRNTFDLSSTTVSPQKTPTTSRRKKRSAELKNTSPSQQTEDSNLVQSSHYSRFTKRARKSDPVVSSASFESSTFVSSNLVNRKRNRKLSLEITPTETPDLEDTGQSSTFELNFKKKKRKAAVQATASISNITSFNESIADSGEILDCHGEMPNNRSEKVDEKTPGRPNKRETRLKRHSNTTTSSSTSSKPKDVKSGGESSTSTRKSKNVKRNKSDSKVEISDGESSAPNLSSSVSSNSSRASCASKKIGNANTDIPANAETEISNNVESNPGVGTGEGVKKDSSEEIDQTSSSKQNPSYSFLERVMNSKVSSNGVSGRFKELLEHCAVGTDASLQLVALQDLSETLSIATEDMFVGGGSSMIQGFSSDAFVRAWISILKGPEAETAMFGDADIPPELMEELGIFGTGGFGSGIMNQEALLLACRCLSNLIEAHPSSSVYVVRHGGVKVLISKLTEIEFIDLAEVVLQVLLRISEEYPVAILRENGLMAVLQFIDFFSLHVQRNAVKIAANLCRGLSSIGVRSNYGISRMGDNRPLTFDEAHEYVVTAMPILEGLMRNSDTKLVEQTVSCFSYTIEWISKHEAKLESYVTPSLIRTIMGMVSTESSQSSPSVVSPAIFVQLVKVLTNIAKGSARLGVQLMSEYGAIEVTRNILTGGSLSLKLNSDEEDAVDEENLTNSVMPVVISRPSEQILEILNFACQLLPKLPKEHPIWGLKVNSEIKPEKTEVSKRSGKEDGDERQNHDDGDVVMDNDRDEEVKKDKGKAKEVCNLNREMPNTGPSTKPINTQKESTNKTAAELEREKQAEEKERDTKKLLMLHGDPEVLIKYVTSLLPILIEVFSTSVNPAIRRKVVECVATSVWHVVSVGHNELDQSGERLESILLKTVGFGKLVSELVATQELVFAQFRTTPETHIPQSPISVASSCSSSCCNHHNEVKQPISVMNERDRRETLMLCSAGVQIAKVVMDNCGAAFKIWFSREGVISEMQKIVDVSEAVFTAIEKDKASDIVTPVTSKSTGPETSPLAQRLGDLVNDLKRVRDQALSLKPDADDKELSEELQSLLATAEELIKKSNITNVDGGSPAHNEDTDSEVNKGNISKNSLTSPTTGAQNILEKLTNLTPESSGNSSGTSTNTSHQRVAAVRSAGSSSSVVVTVGGEKILEHDVKEWIVRSCVEIVKESGLNAFGKYDETKVQVDEHSVLANLAKEANELKKLVQNSAPANISHSVEHNTKCDAKRAVKSAESLTLLETLQKIAFRFAGSSSKAVQNCSELLDGITVYELLESGILDSLLTYFTPPGKNTGTSDMCLGNELILNHIRAFIHVFMNGPTPDALHRNYYVPNAFRNLVQRLQQSLSRIERFEVATAVPSVGSALTDYGFLSSSVSMREHTNPALQLTRQVRIRLVASEPNDVPKNYQNMFVSIHAVATFKALQEYLKSRVVTPSQKTSDVSLDDEVRERSKSESTTNIDVNTLGETNLANGSGNADVSDTIVNADSATRRLAIGGNFMDDFEEDEDEDNREDDMLNVSDLLLHSEEQQRRRRRGASFGSASTNSQSNGVTNLQGSSTLINTEKVVDVRTEVAPVEKPPLVPDQEASKSSSCGFTDDNSRSEPTSSSNVLEPAKPSESTNSTARSFNIRFKIDGEDIKTEMTIFGALYQCEQRRLSQSNNSWFGFGVTSPNIWTQTYTITYHKVYDISTTGAKTKSEFNIEHKHTHHNKPQVPAPRIQLPFATDLPTDITLDHPVGKILCLLRILHGINSRWSELYTQNTFLASNEAPKVAAAAAAEGQSNDGLNENAVKVMAIAPLPPTVFLNNKITTKLNRQLDEPLIMASNVLPSWCSAVARHFSILVPFETRLVYLQSTSFGYSRSMERWQQSGGNLLRSRETRSVLTERDSQIGRIQRQKVRIARNRIVESMIKVMELYGSTQALVEVEFFDEVGTGLGPTLEFYSSVSKALRKRGGVSVTGLIPTISTEVILPLWRDDTPTGQHLAAESRKDLESQESNPALEMASDGLNELSEYVGSYLGLFPAPMTEEMRVTAQGGKIIEIFQTMGTFVSKALLDSRMVDLPFNPIFLEMVVGQEDVEQSKAEELFGIEGRVSSRFHLIKHIDPVLHKSLLGLMKYLQLKRQIENSALSDEEKQIAVSKITVQDATVEDLCLDFTLPGSDIELQKNGSTIPVTIHNISDYISAIIDMVVGSGVRIQIDAFKKGFNRVFPVSDLSCFSVQELGVLVAGSENEDWTRDAIADSIKADHGYNHSSKTVLNLIEMMASFTPVQRREFLTFVTGSPKLPIGGFKALTPPLTVVCKTVSNNTSPGGNLTERGPDDYLPSVMTCVNYLKVPEYSCLSVMRQRFEVAVREGQGCFHLS